jgi:hypothetical protein
MLVRIILIRRTEAPSLDADETRRNPVRSGQRICPSDPRSDEQTARTGWTGKSFLLIASARSASIRATYAVGCQPLWTTDKLDERTEPWRLPASGGYDISVLVRMGFVLQFVRCERPARMHDLKRSPRASHASGLASGESWAQSRALGCAWRLEATLPLSGPGKLLSVLRTR